MLNPARAKSWIVASCSDPLGMPSLSVLGMAAENLSDVWVFRTWRGPVVPCETRSLTGVADVAIAQSGDHHQQRVVVAVDQNAFDSQLVAGSFPLHPQFVARAAEEGRKPALDGAVERLLIHEADHEHFMRRVVL